MATPRGRKPIPIRTLQDLYDNLPAEAAPPPAIYPWGMNPQVRSAIGSYPYQPAVAAPPPPPPMLGYDPRALLEANPAPVVQTAGPGYAGPPDASLYGPNTGATGAGPTTEAEYWAQKWQYDLMDAQAARAEQARQFNAKQQAMNDETVLNRFGQYTPQTSAPTATGLAGQGMAARSAIRDDTMKAQDERAKWAQAVGEQQAAALAGPQIQQARTGPPEGAPPYGGPAPGVRYSAALYPSQVQQLAPYNPRPEWISGPAFGMSVDEGARNTMRGNQAGGIHVDRGNTVGPGAAHLNNLASSSIGSPQGEADYANLERQVLGDPNDPQYPASPRASLLMREEDPGVNGTPAERAYLAMRRRRRQLGGQVRGGTPYDQPAY